VKKMLQYPLFFSQGFEVLVKKEEIMNILFHRGRMLLLDQVTISNGKAIGQFTIPAENCQGHEPISGMLVMRGVEIVEMGFQLAGIILAQCRDPELLALLEGKKFAAREISGAKFNGFVIPGKTITLEANPAIYVDEIAGCLIIEIQSFIAKVDGKKSASISSLTLVGFNLSKVS